jgi:hypothetical protein
VRSRCAEPSRWSGRWAGCSAGPSLTAIEIAWRWLFGIPFLAVCWIAGAADSRALRLNPPGSTRSMRRIPGSRRCSLPRVGALSAACGLRCCAGCAGCRAGLGDGFRPGPQPGAEAHGCPRARRFRPAADDGVAGGVAGAAGADLWGWFRSMEWVAATHITPFGEPDLVGFSSGQSFFRWDSLRHGRW